MNTSNLLTEQFMYLVRSRLTKYIREANMFTFKHILFYRLYITVAKSKDFGLQRPLITVY